MRLLKPRPKRADAISIGVSAQANEKSFGGALPERANPPFIDLLAPSAEDQVKSFSPDNGDKAIFPYVSAE